MIFETEIFSQFDKKWALLTAGTKDQFNMMTISWGSLGTLWNKPVATVYVRTSRYTHDFMDDNELFTISFYPEDFKKALGVMGSKSGRDMDKMKDSGFTPKEVNGSVTFEEAEVTIVCRKLFRQELSVENMPEDVKNSLYNCDAPHDMYIGEVVEIVK
ncbi:MAG: flavin reductase family protein [Eubacterium sp.]|nr:flavin reductase family protein [Eubacterium sp.]